MRVTSRVWLAPIVLAIAGVAVIGVWRAWHHTAQLTLQMRPVTPLTATACVSEARHFGWSAVGGMGICAAGNGRSWYRAVLTNKGAGAYPACTATAVGTNRATVFRGQLPFTLGGFPGPGLFAPGHRSIAFYWYLPQRTHGRIIRYTAHCSANSNPPI